MYAAVGSCPGGQRKRAMKVPNFSAIVMSFSAEVGGEAAPSVPSGTTVTHTAEWELCNFGTLCAVPRADSQVPGSRGSLGP